MVNCSLLDDFLNDVSRAPPELEVVQLLRKINHSIQVARGQTAALGHWADMLVYVAAGATKLIANASGGREQIVAFHFKGDLVSVPSKARHSFELRALVDTQLLVFPAAEFVAATRHAPDLRDMLLERSLVALHRCRDKAVGLGRKSAQERLVSFLISMAERLGQSDNSECIIDLPMSRRDIGDSLGLTIETISRQFGELRDAGFVVTTGRSRVSLLNLKQLEVRAGHV